MLGLVGGAVNRGRAAEPRLHGGLLDAPYQRHLDAHRGGGLTHAQPGVVAVQHHLALLLRKKSDGRGVEPLGRRLLLLVLSLLPRRLHALAAYLAAMVLARDAPRHPEQPLIEAE